jgi:hypothetical protein
LQATGKIEVPDYSSQQPHGMIGKRAVWSLQPGDLLWIPNDAQWGYGNKYRVPEGSEFEVAWSRPYTASGEYWEVVAFGATMLTLFPLTYDELLDTVLPHVPSVCPTCTGLFNQARRSAGLNPLED